MTKLSTSLAILFFFVAVVLAGCNTDDAVHQTEQQRHFNAENAVVVPTVEKSKASGLAEVTLDLRDTKKIYVFATSPASTVYKHVKVVCPNGQKMTINQWTQAQLSLGIPALQHENADEAIVLSGATHADTQSMYKGLPVSAEAKLLSCPCAMKCQTCNDGATVCSSAACECAS